VMSVVLTGKAPYEKVVTYQYVKDENGGEFHKSGGNSLEVDHVADKVGADVIRYLYGSANPVNEVRFGFSLTDEARRKLLSFWNVYTFFNTYACIDNPDIAHFTPKENDLSISDKWLIESVNKFIEDSDKNYADDKSFVVVRDFEKLVDDISNYYIRSNRKRFWKSENKQDQLTAYWCLYYAIKSLIRVMCPIIPFVTEHIWQNLVKEVEKDEAECIMLSGYPERIWKTSFAGVLENTAVARDIMSTAQRLRNENQIKVKQPLKKMYIASVKDANEILRDFEEIIKDELNIKEIECVVDDSMFNDEYLSVNFKKAGAVLKGDVQKLKTSLGELSDDQLKDVMAGYKKGKVNVGEFKDLDSELFNLEKKPKTDFVIAHENGNTVVLDIN
ncbi:MAG: class I tRNA ligase family protein, partial [Clostridia bacterium]|nr:class I tRNA ligase family protein [Clostridia bacterium]